MKEARCIDARYGGVKEGAHGQDGTSLASSVATARLERLPPAPAVEPRMGFYRACLLIRIKGTCRWMTRVNDLTFLPKTLTPHPRERGGRDSTIFNESTTRARRQPITIGWLLYCSQVPPTLLSAQFVHLAVTRAISDPAGQAIF